jgi:alpha-L-arabinofuranosidase
MAGTIKTGEWYDIKIEVNKSEAKIYLNNNLLFTIPSPASPVTASVVKNSQTGEVIVKMINSAPTDINVNFNLKGMGTVQNAKLIVLSGDPSQRNNLENPTLFIQLRVITR